MSTSRIAPIPTVPLHDGGSIPLLGTGSPRPKGDEFAALLADALRSGYRLIDTAAQYANEASVGEGIRRSGVDRGELFVTTKIAGVDQGRGHTRHGLEQSLRKLGTDYVDLLLIHWPNPSRGLAVETWQEMLELQAEGAVRHVGVSNFVQDQLQELHDETGVWPVVDQIQLSPAVQRRELRAFLAEHDIVAEAWRPLGGTHDILAQLPVQRIAARLGRTTGQVVLRWHVQQGIVVIPSSSRLDRMLENADVFDFALTDEDMRDLAALDLGEQEAWDSHTHEEW
jgi:2,5-diketo-D-gluconate reductase A